VLFRSWNYDEFMIRKLTQRPITSMLTVAGKIWCVNSHAISVLNPVTLTLEHNFQIEGDENIILASGGINSWVVWVAGEQSLDIRLYHATKYTILAEINVKQCAIQKFQYVDELIKFHKLSCLKITALFVCKDTLWVGTSAGVIINVKTPHVNNSTAKLNSVINFNALGNGHIGPVRFITSIEISKQIKTTRINADCNNQNSNANQKVMVISGGDGYEEYKMQGQMNNNSSTFSNFNMISEMTNNSSKESSILSAINNAMSSQYTASTMSYNLPQNTSANASQNQHSMVTSSSTNSEENSIGRDDLTNFILVWET